MIYLSELSHHINRSGLGLNLTPEEIVAYLKFAYNIFLIAAAEDALEELKIILEGWCFDFRMKISHPPQKKVISPESSPDWSIMVPTNGNLLELQQVQEYSYLGVMQKITLKQTTEVKNALMLASAKAFQGTLFRLKCTPGCILQGNVGEHSPSLIPLWRGRYTNRPHDSRCSL